MYLGSTLLDIRDLSLLVGSFLSIWVGGCCVDSCGDIHKRLYFHVYNVLMWRYQSEVLGLYWAFISHVKIHFPYISCRMRFCTLSSYSETPPFLHKSCSDMITESLYSLYQIHIRLVEKILKPHSYYYSIWKYWFRLQ